MVSDILIGCTCDTKTWYDNKIISTIPVILQNLLYSYSGNLLFFVDILKLSENIIQDSNHVILFSFNVLKLSSNIIAHSRHCDSPWQQETAQ